MARLAYEAGAQAVKLLTWDRLRPADHDQLPQGYDVVDWVECLCRRSEPEKGLKASAAHIRAVAAQTPPESRATTDVVEPDGNSEFPPLCPTWKPYSADVLPRPLCDCVEASAKAMGCEPSFVALPLLTACGAAVGLTRRLKAKAQWVVPPILWSMIIGESGFLKTPALSKLEEIPLRLALILHLARQAAGESVNPDLVDGNSMRRAIALTEWHKHETARIYEILERGVEGNQQEELLQWIARRGGKVTVSELYSFGPRQFRGNREEAKDAHNDLVKAVSGHW